MHSHDAIVDLAAVAVVLPPRADRLAAALVVWWPAALNELTELWLESNDRAAVTADAREVDRRLAEQASEWGDNVTDGVRVMDLAHVGVYFRRLEEDR